MLKKIIGIILLVCLFAGCGQEVTAQDSPGYAAGEDHQQFWNRFGSTDAWCFTKAEEGYYYFDSEERLIRYYDLKAETSVPLCGQPDCDHDSEDCNAYIPFSVQLDCFQYYKGNLYTLVTNRDDSNDLCVYRISSDGATREKVGTLFSLEGNAGYSCIMHRGYVYCALYSGGLSRDGVHIYRMALSGGAPEIIYTTEKRSGGSVKLNAFGNSLYIHHSYFTDGSGSGYTGELHRWNIHDGESELVHDDIWRDYAVDGSNLYYDNGTQIVAYGFASGEETVLAEPGMPVYLGYAEGSLYYDNWCGIWISGGDYSSRAITVLDPANPAEACSVHLEGNHSEWIGADGVNLIARIVRKDAAGDYSSGVYMYTFDEMLTGHGEWKEAVR